MAYTKGKWTTKITDKKSYAGDLVFSDSGQLVCDCNISNLDESECKANAKRIAMAVNSHDDLLEVARAIILENDIRKQAGLAPLTNTLNEIATAAIKKATE